MDAVRRLFRTGRKWGTGLSWLLTIGLGWVAFWFVVQFLEDLAMTGNKSSESYVWFGAFMFVLGAGCSAWFWLCCRLVFSCEPLWQRGLGLLTVSVGLVWLAGNPLFDTWFTINQRQPAEPFTAYSWENGTVFLAALFGLWLVAPLFREFYWSQRLDMKLLPRPLWRNPWIVRGVVVFLLSLFVKLLVTFPSPGIGQALISFEPERVIFVAGLSAFLLIPIRLIALFRSVLVQCLVALFVWPIFLYPGFVFSTDIPHRIATFPSINWSNLFAAISVGGFVAVQLLGLNWYLVNPTGNRPWDYQNSYKF